MALYQGNGVLFLRVPYPMRFSGFLREGVALKSKVTRNLSHIAQYFQDRVLCSLGKRKTYGRVSDTDSMINICKD
jgi:hypothetical protein